MHAPPQPAKKLLAPSAAVSITTVPAAKGARQVGELRLSDGVHQPAACFIAAEKTGARDEEWVEEADPGPLSLYFPRKSFHGLSIVPKCPYRTHIGAHAGADDGIDGNTVLFENLDDSDVGEAFGASSG